MGDTQGAVYSVLVLEARVLVCVCVCVCVCVLGCANMKDVIKRLWMPAAWEVKWDWIDAGIELLRGWA